MKEPSRTFKIGSLVWSVLIALCVLALGASIMLPSTKRARFNFEQMEKMRAEQESSTQPTTSESAPSSVDG